MLAGQGNTVVAGGPVTSGGPSSTSRLPAVYLAGNGTGQRPDVPGRERRAAGAAGRGHARRHRRPAGCGYIPGIRQVHVQTARPGRRPVAVPAARWRVPRVTRRWPRSPRWCRGRGRGCRIRTIMINHMPLTCGVPVSEQCSPAGFPDDHEQSGAVLAGWVPGSPGRMLGRPLEGAAESRQLSSGPGRSAAAGITAKT